MNGQVILVLSECLLFAGNKVVNADHKSEYGNVKGEERMQNCCFSMGRE